MMFDIGWDVLVMRMGGCQCWIVRMSLRVIPIQFLVVPPYFVAITAQSRGNNIKAHDFYDLQAHSGIKVKSALNRCYIAGLTNDGESSFSDNRIFVLQGVDK